MRTLLMTGMLAVLLTTVAAARADEVTFLNGDRLTGKIIRAAGGKLVIKTDAAGEVTVDMSKVNGDSTRLLPLPPLRCIAITQAPVGGASTRGRSPA